MTLPEFIALVVFVVLCVVTALPGALFRPGDWYERLAKPSWCPPNWLFGPAWLVLYSSIAVSGWLVWRDGEPGAVLIPLAIYAVQLVLNALWSAIFFGLRRPDLALLEVVLLLVSIGATIVAFYFVSQIPAVLLIPYFLWVGFAATLNLSIVKLNPALPDAGNQRS